MDYEAQNDELVVLSSIYEDHFHETVSTDSKGGELIINLDLPEKIVLSIANGIGGKPEQQSVMHLPPIYLHFSYPTDYPSSAAPQYTLTCKWITRPQLSLICQQLDRLWEEKKGDVILYTWSQYIKEETAPLLNIGDILNVDDIRPKWSDLARSGATAAASASCSSSPLKSSDDQSKICDIIDNVIDNRIRDNTSVISSKCSAVATVSASASCYVLSKHPRIVRRSSSVYDDRTVQDVGPKTNLMMLLREYDLEMRHKVFKNKTFECKVCFLEKIGTQCMEFWPCSHVYCNDCMTGYFEVQIREGNVKFLKCPSDKCTSEANPKQVEQLVSSELYQRWDALLLSSTLNELGDTQPCPRQHCQYPVTIDKNQGYCPACSFVFCALCRFGEHGVDPCKLRNSEARKVLEEYMSGDSMMRKALEDRFGKKYLTKLQEELLTMNYLCDNAKRCPKCNANIEKVDGCNKMVCQCCGVSFCWLCMTMLDPARPYSHFNGPTSKCYDRLFEGVMEPGGAEDDEFYPLFLD